MTRNVVLDAVAAELFGYADAHVTALVDQLARTNPERLGQIRQEAQLTRLNATVQAIGRHVAALDEQRDPAAEADFLHRYRRHIHEHHGKLEPPDFERRRRIPLQELYVPAAVTHVVDPNHTVPPLSPSATTVGPPYKPRRTGPSGRRLPAAPSGRGRGTVSDRDHGRGRPLTCPEGTGVGSADAHGP